MIKELHFLIGSVDISYGSCSGTYDNIQKTIKTPNYPEKYGQMDACEWDIKTTPGYGVELKFLDFVVENTFDYLEIYDAMDASSPKLLRNLTGTKLPNNIVSPGNLMNLKWRSDASRQKTGFKIKVTARCKHSFYLCNR